MKEVEYCVGCGEALTPFSWPFCTKLSIEGRRTSWHDSHLPMCPNAKCPRYGLLTGMVDNTLEEAQENRKKFAKKKP